MFSCCVLTCYIHCEGALTYSLSLVTLRPCGSLKKTTAPKKKRKKRKKKMKKKELLEDVNIRIQNTQSDTHWRSGVSRAPGFPC